MAPNLNLLSGTRTTTVLNNFGRVWVRSCKQRIKILAEELYLSKASKMENVLADATNVHPDEPMSAVPEKVRVMRMTLLCISR